MLAFAFQATTGSGGQIQGIARTFGVDWPHLAAQIVSFTIMCAILYVLAYKPILGMLSARRAQIASGLANAERIRTELGRIEAERHIVLAKAEAQGRQLIDEARAAARRVEDEQRRKAMAAADQILARAHEGIEHDRARLISEVKRDIARLVVRTTAAVTGKVLTADDHRRLVDETAKQLKPANDNNQKGATGSSPAAAAVLRR